MPPRYGEGFPVRAKSPQTNAPPRCWRNCSKPRHSRAGGNPPPKLAFEPSFTQRRRGAEKYPPSRVADEVRGGDTMLIPPRNGEGGRREAVVEGLHLDSGLRRNDDGGDCVPAEAGIQWLAHCLDGLGACIRRSTCKAPPAYAGAQVARILPATLASGHARP